MPRHIRVRGVDGMDCFTCDRDRHVFQGYLHDALAHGGCSLHAYVLMSNHVHLLATGNRPGSVAALMHRLGLRYARYFNTSHARTGALFEGRYRASPVEEERYFLVCMRYIELNPVRAGIVERAVDYPWSSHRHNVGLEVRDLLTFHEEYLRLGRSPQERASAWAATVADGLASVEVDRIRRQLRSNRPLIGVRFANPVREPDPIVTSSRSRPP